MNIERFTVPLTTSSGGAAEGFTPYFTGEILAIHYAKNNFDDGVDFTITGDVSGETIWTEANVNTSKSCAPRMATHSTAGVAATYDGTNAVNGPVALSKDRVKIAIAAGGNAKSGTFHVIVKGRAVGAA